VGHAGHTRPIITLFWRIAFREILAGAVYFHHEEVGSLGTYLMFFFF